MDERMIKMINGVQFDAVDLGGALKRATADFGHPCFAVTPNAVMLDAARRDSSLCALLNRADLSLADGAGVLLAARHANVSLPCRIAGIAFGEKLLSEAAARGWRVFLLGGREWVAEDAAERLSGRFSQLCICGTQHGYFDRNGAENTRILAKIRESRADILFVCLGFPLQEQWLDANLPSLEGLRLGIGLGGALDVWSGRVRRAPDWISRMGLEWAFRMLCEPRRLRYLPALIRCVTAKPKRTH